MDWYIKTYEPSDAASIAQMWNESDEGWPGGFTAGVPFTEERIRQWLSEERPIDIFLVVADNRVVAYCSMYEYGAESSAAYVALLNCHPRYWRHGFGRELLKKAVARSTELGYKRLDLHTWPGNMRAVPLYKKTGFFWQPETQVHMLNFLPLILPLARDFFADTDWYTTFQRELAVKEDDITWHGMKVYPYSFQKDGHILKAIIDRESRGLTAFENDDFSAACQIETQELIAGLASPVRWEIVNKTQSPLPVSLLASGESGLSISKKAMLEVRDRTVIEGEVLVERDIVPHDKDDAAHKITTTLVVGGHLLVLETGVRPQQAVEIVPEPPYVSLTPGLPQTVHLRLRNRLKEPARAHVALLPPATLKVEAAQQTVELPADGYGGMTCTMLATGAGALAVSAAVSVESAQATIEVKPVPLPVAAPGVGKPSVYLRQDEVVLENTWMRLVVLFKGAQMMLYRTENNQMLLYHRSALGPPFYPNEFRSMRFAVRTEEKDGSVCAILSAASRQHRGVIFERVFTLDASSVLTIDHRLHNTGAQEHTFQVRAACFSQFGESSLALPTSDGLVVDLMPSFPDWWDDETRQPTSLAESWLALNGNGFTLGVIWSNAKEQEFDSWTRPNVKINVPTLPAYGHVDAPSMYIYAGPGDWRDVRRAWRRLVQPTAPAAVEPRRLLIARTTPSPLLLLNGKAVTSLHLDNQRARPLSGTVQINAPSGWTISPANTELSGLKRGSPYDLPITVRRAKGKEPAIAEGYVTVRHELAHEHIPLPLIALGRRRTVELSEYREQGQRLVSIANGWMRLVVAPDFVGSVIALERDSVNHLFSSFPTARALSWMNPWHGGVSAVLMASDEDEAGPGNPGRMHLETWSYELLRPSRAAAIPWTGVRVTSTLTHNRFRGLRLEMDYLTVGESNLLVIVARLVNKTAAPFGGIFVTQAYLQPGGERDKSVLYDLERRRVLRMRDHFWSGASGRWAGVAHGDNGPCLALISGSGGGQIIAQDMGMDGAHLFNVGLPSVAPQSSLEMISYLVLAPDVTQARLYRWLEQWTWQGM